MSSQWPQSYDQIENTNPITAQILEDRINMYISAMDRANVMNDSHQSAQLQRDIQQLVDLMERVSAGQVVTGKEVPPPLVITPQIDVLANPLGELSSRLADYHKALYFAEEELSEDRINKIQRLQRGLQTIHELQKRAQAGFPVRADEIPPPVTIPSDDEFDNDPVSTLIERLAHYRAALTAAETAGGVDRRRIPKIQNSMRIIEFLMTRARAKRPVWKKDIPPEFDYHDLGQVQTESKPVNEAKFTLQLRSLSLRVGNVKFQDEEGKKSLEEINKKLKELTEGGTKFSQAHLESSLSALTKQLDMLEKRALAEKMGSSVRISEDLSLVETRIKEYKTAAVNCKQEKQVKHAIQHLKVVKGLQSLKETLEKGEPVDMTLVPPPPREFTPSSDSPPPFPAEEEQRTVNSDISRGATAHLSPVNIKPAIETNEDKLAKKLSSYLEEGEEHNASSNFDPTIPNGSGAVPPSKQSHLKVKGAGEGMGISAGMDSKKSFTLDSIGMLPCENGNALVKTEKPNKGEMDKVALKPNEDSLERTVGSERPESMSTAEPVSHAVSVQNQETKAPEQLDGKEGQDATAKVESLPQKSVSSPSKSSEIYTRKTIDSVGFLSCQNVPENSQSERRIPNSNCQESKTFQQTPEMLGVEETRASSDDGNIGLQPDARDDTSKMSDSVKAVFQDSDAVFRQEDHEVVCTSNDKNTVSYSGETQSPYGVTPADTSGLSNYAADQILAESDHQSSSITLPSKTLSEAHESCNGPASLSSTVVSNNLKVTSNNLNTSQSISQVPDITTVPNSSVTSNHTYQENENSSQPGTEIRDSSTFSTVFDPHTSTAADTQLNQEHSNSSDMLEFQDLMESMAVSSVAVSSSSQHDGSAVTVGDGMPIQSDQAFISDENKASEGRSTANQIISAENAMWRSELVSAQDMQLTTSKTDIATPVTQHNTLPAPDGLAHSDTLDSSVSNQEQKDNQVKVASNFHIYSGVATGIDQSTASRDLPSSTFSASVQDSDKNFHLFSSQPRSLSMEQPIVHSKPQSRNAEQQAGNVVHDDVAFTCLENLKYDWLLKQYEDTEKSRQEEKELKSKLDQIKFKLRHGGKQIWEVYKLCVQKELSSIIQQIENLRALQQWSDIKMLSEKRAIAERELIVLKERLPELRY